MVAIHDPASFLVWALLIGMVPLAGFVWALRKRDKVGLLGTGALVALFAGVAVWVGRGIDLRQAVSENAVVLGVVGCLGVALVVVAAVRKKEP